MKSTVKIDVAPNRKSIIKIIRPQEVLDLDRYPDGDCDVRDKHVNDLLKSQLNCEPYTLFQVGSQGMLEHAPFEITTIIPVEPNHEVALFKNLILTRYVPKSALLAINRQEASMDSNPIYQKVNEFFAWLEKQNPANYYERFPDQSDGLIDIKSDRWDSRKFKNMNLELKKHIIETAFGFDKLTISEVIEICLNIDNESVQEILNDIQTELAGEI